ncbi:FHA domain-containing protein [Paenibacillus sp. CC-CFT747]|nr:FHA domain-containing protein [Paenibacillus sp. CC-CFT747]
MVTETFRIGRETGTVQLLLETAGISRQHAEIVRTPEGGHLVRDLGSKNGTLLNGEVMVPFQEYELKDGDCLEMAGVRITRTDSPPPGEAGKIQVS